MKHLIFLIVALFSLFLTENIFANVRIKDIFMDPLDSNSKKEWKKAIIKFQGDLNVPPKLTVKDSLVQVAIDQSIVWPSIEKKATLEKNFDTTFLAYQFNKNVVRFRALLPFSLKGNEHKVQLSLKGDTIEVNIPRKMALANKGAEAYDESYLEKLLQGKSSGEKKEERDEVSLVLSGKVKEKVKEEEKEEEKKEIKDNAFSFTPYVAKFTGFLILVIALFLGIVSLFKKGILKRGKLGFLNNTKLITVLSSSYIAPKKNLVVVKVHRQIFLLATSDKGVHFLSELNDVAGILKNGEVALSGENFDTSFDVADKKSKEFKLKEELKELDKGGPSGVDEVKDEVKLSERIKSKVKGLKALQ